MQATPAKLNSGAWGARVMSGSVHVGDSIQIRTRTGKSWTATVTRVLWHDHCVSLVATGSASEHSHSARGKWTGCSCGSRVDEYGELIPSPHNCAQCRFDG